MALVVAWTFFTTSGLLANWWIVVGGGAIGAVAFGSPPGIAWNPLEGPETFDAVQAGYLIAPADILEWRRRRDANSIATQGLSPRAWNIASQIAAMANASQS